MMQLGHDTCVTSVTVRATLVYGHLLPSPTIAVLIAQRPHVMSNVPDPMPMSFSRFLAEASPEPPIRPQHPAESMHSTPNPPIIPPHSKMAYHVPTNALRSVNTGDSPTIDNCWLIQTDYMRVSVISSQKPAYMSYLLQSNSVPTPSHEVIESITSATHEILVKFKNSAYLNAMIKITNLQAAHDTLQSVSFNTSHIYL
jgi:hypothetical protein